MLFLFTTALATPSAVCPGACAADGLACGGPEDCGGGDCVFDDVCLPGGSFAIARVVPEAEVALADYGAWYAFGLPGAGEVDGKLSVGFSLDYGGYYAYQSVAITPHTRYALRASIELQPGVYGFLEGVLPVSQKGVFAATPYGAGPLPTAFVFDSGDETELQVLAYGTENGTGGAALYDDFALVELRDDYSLFVRAAIDDPVGDASFGSSYVIEFGGPEFYAQLPFTPIPAGGWSDWVDLGSAFAADTVTIGFELRDAADQRLGAVDGRLQVAWAARDDAVLKEVPFTSASGAIGVWSAAGTPNPLGLADRFVTLPELFAQDPALYRAQPDYAASPQPVELGSVTGLGWWDGWGDWSALHPAYELVHDLGLNGLVELGYPDDERATLAADGIDGWRYMYYGPPGTWISLPAPAYDLDQLDLDLAADLAAYPVVGQVLDDYAADPDHVLVDLTDEAYGLYFDDPAYDEAFRDWLRTEVLHCADPEDPVTCTPESFGKADWADVVALHTMHNSLVDDARPDPADVDAARLFYQQLRWWSVATARVFAHTRAAVEAEAPGDPPRISPNLGTPFAVYMTWRMGTELQTLLGEGAINAFQGEAFTGWNDWCLGQELSAYADWVDGETSPWGVHRRSAHLTFNRGSGPHKALSLAARGTDLLDWYTYGPSQVTTGDGMAGFGGWSLDPLHQIQDGTRALAIAEPALVGAHRVTGGVAMMATQSDPLWWSAATDVSDHTSALSYDELGTYDALTHGHVPVRFLVEERLPTDLGPDTTTLFVHRRYVSGAAFSAIEAWVEAGGTLILSGELPVDDELAQRDPARVAWLGTDPGPVDPAPGAYIVDWDGVGALTVTTPRRSLDPTAGSVLATYEDGGAAVVERAVGAGKVRMIGFEVGAAYRNLDPACLNTVLPGYLGAFPTGYSPAVRSAVLDAVSAEPRPADTDQPLVELIPLTTPTGGAVVILNYSGAPLAGLAVSVPGAVDGQALFAGAPVAVDGAGTFTVDLDDVEVVQWTLPPPATTPPTTTVTTRPVTPPEEPASSDTAKGGCGCSEVGGGGWLAAMVLATALGRRGVSLRWSRHRR